MHIKLIVISLVLLIFMGNLSAQNDSIILSNGNLLVGEIKTLQKGVLTIETNYSDSDFKIEWDHVSQIYSQRQYLISLSTGDRLNGSINTDLADSSRVLIIDYGMIHQSDIADVVYLKAIEGDFLGNFSASLDFGVTLTKANNLKQFTARSSLGYVGKTFGANAAYDAVRSAQDSVAPTNRTDASIGGRYLLKKAWFVLLTTNFLQNDEQKLKLRSTTKSGFGNYFVNSNRVYFSGAAGMAWTNEKFTDDQPLKNSIEGFAGLELNLFDIEDFSLLTTLSVFPGITEKGRVRIDFKTDLKYDLPLDFYIKLGYTHNFDNQPASNSSKHDYVFQTTVGWEL